MSIESISLHQILFGPYLWINIIKVNVTGLNTSQTGLLTKLSEGGNCCTQNIKPISSLVHHGFHWLETIVEGPLAVRAQI